MAVTRSTAAGRPQTRRAGKRWRARELLGLLLAGALVALGLHLVYQAKAPGLAEAAQGLAAKRLLNLNDLSAREDLLPALGTIADAHARTEAARQIYYASGGLANVGALARILPAIEAAVRGAAAGAVSERLLPVGGAVLRAFLLVHVWWSVRGFRGDQWLLPAVMLLAGAGLVLMVSLRDPVRDNCCSWISRRAWWAARAAGGGQRARLRAAVRQAELRAAAGQLRAFGAAGAVRVGAGTSDAKVNLLGFQPVEIIRVLLVLLPGGLFRQRWDVLRHARETRAAVAALTKRWIFRRSNTRCRCWSAWRSRWCSSSCSGTWGRRWCSRACSWCSTGGARQRAGAGRRPGAGGAGFAAGYWLGVPHTVGERVAMWLSPWDNLVHGGDQLAHSLWAYATGGAGGHGHRARRSASGAGGAHRPDPLGAGRGVGLPGSGGGVRALRRGWCTGAARGALRARTDYEFFLAAGLAAATALQILLIAGGALGVVPLSGVVTPFLSYGRTAMLANFAVIGMVAAISRARAGRRTAVPRARCRGRGRFAIDGRPWCWPRRGTCRCCAMRHHGRRARWWCRPMARAAISTTRASGSDARDSQGHHLRPQRAAAGHQRLGRAGKASRRLPAARHRYRQAPARAARAAIIRSAG
jgi:hypothetical protein